MGAIQLLHGSCSCGRNEFLIVIPSDANDKATVLFEDSSDHRRAHSTPLPTFLRIPLPWLHSTTYAFYPDETHTSIRRVFTPRHAPATKRHFCGFCGSPLSYWSEDPREEAEYVRVSLESLRGESLGLLGKAGVLPSIEVEREKLESKQEGVEGMVLDARADEGRETRGQPWFEEIIEGSELGRLRRRRGGETSKDGRSSVEWEIVEMGIDEDEGEGKDAGSTGTTKRKLGEMGEPEDISMRGGS